MTNCPDTAGGGTMQAFITQFRLCKPAKQRLILRTLCPHPDVRSLYTAIMDNTSPPINLMALLQDTPINDPSV